MKKLFYLCAAAAIVAACTGASSTKVSNEENCDCLICEACDSFMKYNDMDEEAYDSTWTCRHSDNYIDWSDSLATLVYEQLCDTTIEYDAIQDLLNNEKLMYIMNKTCWDGLCGIKDTTGTIDYFCGAQRYYNK